MTVKTGIGQDSHAFDFGNTEKQLVLAGVVFPDEMPLKGNSDADVVLHAVTNAISGVTGKNILGKVADEMCKQGITDSCEYLKAALQSLGNYQIDHLSISIECLKPKISPKIDAMKASLAELLSIRTEDVGITATTGEGLTEFGKGNGIQVFAVVTVSSFS